MRDGKYKKISAAFYRPEHASNPSPGAFYLRHVGFLGAQPPIVKGLPTVQFADEADYDTVEFSEADPWTWRSLGRMFRGLREHLIATSGLETADRVVPDYDVQALAEEAERLSQESRAVAANQFSEEETHVDPMPTTDAGRETALNERETRPQCPRGGPRLPGVEAGPRGNRGLL